MVCGTLFFSACSDDEIRTELDDPNTPEAGNHHELGMLIVRDYKHSIYHLDSLMRTEQDSLYEKVKLLHEDKVRRFLAYGRQMENLDQTQRDSCKAMMMNRLYNNVKDPMLRIREHCDSLRKIDPLNKTASLCDDLIMVGQYADYQALRRLRPEVYDTLTN